MHTSPPTLPALFAGLRTALEADARGVSSLILALLLRLLAQLETLATTRHTTPTRRPIPSEYGEDGRLRFHLRLRDARRALVLARGSKGRIRFPTWWDRNRGARAIPSRAPTHARATTARAPPRAAPSGTAPTRARQRTPNSLCYRKVIQPYSSARPGTASSCPRSAPAASPAPARR